MLFLSLLPGACLLPVDEGPCRAQIERYFYNTVKQKCEVFYYGGCQGNANNFKSYLECQKSCFRIPSEFCRVLDEPPPPPPASLVGLVGFLRVWNTGPGLLLFYFLLLLSSWF